MIRWQGVDIFSDIVFLVDTVFQSHSAYWLNDPLNGKWILMDRVVEIRYTYFTEYRPVCFASTLHRVLSS